MTSVALPTTDGKTETYRLTGKPTERPSAPPVFNRIATSFIDSFTKRAQAKYGE